MVDAEMTKFLNGVTGVVEANSFEALSLWSEYAKPRKKIWIENRTGLLETIGEFGGMPICVSLQTAIIDGQNILFVDPTSAIVDHRMVRKWLENTLPKSAWKGDRLNYENAMNFHNALE